ncbi:MAG: hypothetical protein Q7S33_03975 [Nanoarchaeota archaeon]|nr:hypothetical protein [Nanoarchaeota archaeon]
MKDLVSTIGTAGKTLGKAIAHPILGILPEQEKLEKIFKGYKSNLGVISNSILEIIYGLNGIGTFSNESFIPSSYYQSDLTPWIYGAMIIDGLARIYPYNHPQSKLKNTLEKRGSWFLEIPNYFAKKIEEM